MSRADATDLRLVRLQVVAVTVSALLIAVLLLPLPVQLRLVVAVLFVMFAPGTALLTLIGWRLAETAALGLVIALGMALTVIAAQLIMLAGVFDARLDLIVAAIVVIGVIAFLRLRPGPAAADGPVVDPGAGDTVRDEGPRVGGTSRRCASAREARDVCAALDHRRRRGGAPRAAGRPAPGR